MTRRAVLPCLLLQILFGEALAGQDLLQRLGLESLAQAPVVGAWPPSRPVDESWSFLVGGHLYGDPARAGPGPAATFCAAAAGLREPGDVLFVSLGDVYRTRTTAVRDATRSVLHELALPVFNAVGNHDVPRLPDGRPVPARRYGVVAVRDTLMLILDTEEHPWSVRGDQKRLLKDVCRIARDRDEVKRLMIFGHKLVFAIGDPDYADLFAAANARDGLLGLYPSNNFHTEILPLVRGVARKKPVTWFAGDVGLSPWFHLSWHRDAPTGITYVTSGLADRPRDALLRVHVTDAGVTLEPVPLGPAAPKSLESCTRAAWRQRLAAAQIARPEGAHLVPGRIVPLDPDGDGVAELLRLPVSLQVAADGTYTVHGRLRARSGVILGVARAEIRLIARVTGRVKLDFAGERLARAGLNGPHEVVGLSIEDAAGTTVRLRTAPLSTGPLPVIDFQEPGLEGPATLSPGSAGSWTLRSPADARRPYRLGLTLEGGPGRSLSELDPFGRDGRRVPLPIQDLAAFAVLPSGFKSDGTTGSLDDKGLATVKITLPDHPSLVGRTLHLAAVIEHPGYPLGIRAFTHVMTCRIR